MKKMLIAVGLVLAVAAAASAQTTTRSFAINVGAGLSLPIGDFGDVAGIGFHGDGALMWNVAPKINVGPAASYHFMDADFTGADGSWGVLLLGGDIQYLFSEPMGTTDEGTRIMPFLVGGLGIGVVSSPDFEFAGETFDGESSSDLFISLGAGANMQRWFGKIRWVSVMTEGSSSSFFPLTVGYRF